MQTQPLHTSKPSEEILRKRVLATAVDLAMTAFLFLLLLHAHLIFASAALMLFLLRDTRNWASPGRILTSINAVSRGYKPCTAKQSFMRNITLLPPFLFVEIGLLLFLRRSHRIGDIIAGTTIVQDGLANAPRTECAQTAAMPPLTDAQADTLQQVCEEDPISATEAEHSPAADELPTDDLSAELLDSGLLTPESITAEDVRGEKQECDETLQTSAGPASDSTECTPSADDIIRQFYVEPESACENTNAPSIPVEIAAKCLAIEGEVDFDTVDDAYWGYVERYSPDATAELDDDALLERCLELADQKTDLPFSSPCAPSTPNRDACLRFLNSWMIIVNKCRDVLG